MKRIKFLALLAFAAFTAVSFNACKGDDDGDDDNKDENVLVEKNGTKYTVKISDLSDNDSELSFTETYNYVEPEEAKVEMKYVFKYAASIALEPADSTATDSVSTSAPAEVVKDSLPITLWKIITTCDKEEYAQSVYESYKADSTENANAVIEIDDNVVTCTYSGEEDFIYLMVKAIYDRHKESIDKDLDKAKAAAEANKNKPENGKENTNTKTNYNFNKDSVGAIVNVDSTIGYTIVKSGVASVYSFSYDKNGNITSGTIVCECKNSEVAKAYAKEHMRDRNDNDERIYKSVSLDGNKVIMVYSDAAVSEMKISDVENQYEAQKGGKSDTDTTNNEAENSEDADNEAENADTDNGAENTDGGNGEENDDQNSEENGSQDGESQLEQE